MSKHGAGQVPSKLGMDARQSLDSIMLTVVCLLLCRLQLRAAACQLVATLSG
jgi:hypothetical protein